MEPNNGNYNKYMSKNPLMHLATRRFLDNIISLVDSVDISSILDAGCGEGFVACRLVNKRLICMDISSLSLKVARQRISNTPLIIGDVYNMPFQSESFDMVIMSEVLEHLENPENALYEVARVSKKYCILSVPEEPYFMLMNLLRGKNIIRLGNDREHIQHWTKKGFLRYVSRYFDVLEVRSPYPWTVVLCKKKKSRDGMVV